MEISATCPACHRPMRWLLHDDIDIYICGSTAGRYECPISFEEEIQHPAGVPVTSITEGVLMAFSFIIENYQIRVTQYPSHSGPLFTVTRFVDTVTLEPERARREWFRIFQIPYTFEIDWQHLDKFKQKLKTWIIFS